MFVEWQVNRHEEPRPRKCLEFIGPTASVAGAKWVLSFEAFADCGLFVQPIDKSRLE